MSPKFGTSGLRGLATDLTQDCVANYVSAFLNACETGSGVYVGHDLRASSPRIADDVITAIRAQGKTVFFCGPVPTPALALAAMQAKAAAVMVTGSHIPADRNGLKFYKPSGEISKGDEQAMIAALGAALSDQKQGDLVNLDQTNADYAARYLAAYDAALRGMTIGVFAHSAVGRDMLAKLLVGLGATVVMLGASDTFIPIDTEAVSADIRAQLRDWAKVQGCNAIISTDADGDRPLVADETGEVVPGDILGQITARSLGADVVVTPVSSNSGAEIGQAFTRVIRTRIGSPYVIAGMERTAQNTVGYEANGGFLLGFDAQGTSGPTAALMTRDALLPIIATLSAARGTSVSARVAQEPKRFTATDRLQDIPAATSARLVGALLQDKRYRARLLDRIGQREAAMNTVDGPRITLENGRILHVRPSGNAPELRVYVEAETLDAAQKMLAESLKLIADQLA